jgi:hypothetical protein
MNKVRTLLLPLSLLAVVAGGCTASETLALDASMKGTTGGSGGSATGAGGQVSTTGTGGQVSTTGAGGSGGTAGTGGGGSGGGGTGGRPVTDAGADRVGGGDAGADAAKVLSFMTDVAPIIANKCKTCHTVDAKAGLNFSFANLVTSSKVTNTTTMNCTMLDASKQRVVPGMPDVSLVWIKLSHTAAELSAAGCGMAMPAMGTLTTQEKDTFKNWIAQGAKP